MGKKDHCVSRVQFNKLGKDIIHYQENSIREQKVDKEPVLSTDDLEETEEDYEKRKKKIHRDIQNLFV